VTVNPVVDHLGADVNAEFPDREDAKTIPQDGERDHRESEQGPFPRRTQKHMAREKTHDEQDQTGVNAAAFGRNGEGKIIG